MKTITIALNKGGTGKTTTVSSLAAALREKGFKVLVIDTDPQGNLTSWYSAKNYGKTSCDVMTGNIAIDDAIQHTEAMDIIASSPMLAHLDAELSSEPGKEYRLKEAMLGMKSKYDYVLIDTPPALSIQLSNALTCSDGAILTAQADVFSLQGIDQLATTVKLIQKRMNANLRIYGILVSKFQTRVNVEKLSLKQMEAKAAEMGTKVFDTKIRTCSALKESAMKGKDIFRHAPKSNAAKDYAQLAEEILTITGDEPKTIE